MYRDRINCAAAIEEAERLGHPTHGEFAAFLSEWADPDVSGFTPAECAELYRRCGYEPFEGYPLVRLATRRPSWECRIEGNFWEKSRLPESPA